MYGYIFLIALIYIGKAFHYLMKLFPLQEAAAAFPKINQSPSLKSNIKPFGDSLVKHGVLQHKDKDIRLLVAICFCEILRVLAPDPGFGEAVSKVIRHSSK